MVAIVFRPSMLTGPRLGMLGLAFTLKVSAAVLPADRMIDFTLAPPGVQGGIIHRTTVFTNLVDAGADPTGAVPVNTILNAAINACPSNQVVFIPAGTFLLTNQVNMKSGITLRGAGMDQTRLVVLNDNSANGIHFRASPSVYYQNNNPVYSNDVYSITGKGGTNLSLAPGPYRTNYTAGRFMLIDMTNAPNLYLQGGLDGDAYMGRLNGSRLFRQLVEILTVEHGTNLTFTPPLIWDYTNAPQVLYMPSMFRHAGLEDFTITNACAANISGTLVSLEQAADCWVKNVGAHRAYTENIVLSYGFRCTITGCDLRHNAEYRYSGRAYALLVRYASTQNLIQDNVFDLIRSGLILTSSGPYNTFAYNFVNSTTNAGAGIILGCGVNHGGNPWWNLWEGNVGSGFMADLFHGGSLYQILFRNYARGWHPNATPTSTNYYQRAINLLNSNMFYSVVGNVLGSPDIGEGNSQYDAWRYEYNSGDTPPSSAVPTIWRLGYITVGVSTEGWDAATGATLFRHGNFDFAHTNIVDWQEGYDHTLPDSLYLTAKPDWWGDLAWPPIGPDMPDVETIHLRTNLIPAQARFYGYDYGVGADGKRPHEQEAARPAPPQALWLTPD